MEWKGERGKKQESKKDGEQGRMVGRQEQRKGAGGKQDSGVERRLLVK